MQRSDFAVTSSRRFGWVEIRSDLAPISLQAAAGRRSELKGALRSALSDEIDFLFTSDVEVILEWFASERDRYQTHVAADLDNVLKPLIDAATGPNGVMIDDNQIQSIHASWLTPGTLGEGFRLRFQALDSCDVIPREGVAFVEFDTDRCYMLPGPDPKGWPPAVDAYRASADTRDRLRRTGVPEEALQGLSPVARPWPSQRLKMQGFPVHRHSTILR